MSYPRNIVVNGVIIPPALWDESVEEQQKYAVQVRKGNSAVIRDYWRLEDEANRLGLTMEDLEAGT